jgi:hypothetical protein
MKPIVALLLLACSSVAFAQKPPAACGLVKPAELSALLGMKVGPGQENDLVIQEGTFKGQTATMCTWGVPQGTVMINVIRVASPAQRTAGLAEMQKNTRDLQAMLKAQGWTSEEANVGGLKCLTATPPPARKTPIGTSCSADVVKGLALSLGANLVGAKLPPAKMKAIYDTVIKRF